MQMVVIRTFISNQRIVLSATNVLIFPPSHPIWS